MLGLVSAHLKTDLGLDYDFGTLGPPRNLTNLENYLQRAEWQYYKSSAREEDFLALIAYAQHDPRYLRAVVAHQPEAPGPERREPQPADGAAVPRGAAHQGRRQEKGGRPSRRGHPHPVRLDQVAPARGTAGSLALDNFLLPGNKEDGADKSRHWNVFGGICLYKSPQEALDLALRREMQDLRDDGLLRGRDAGVPARHDRQPQRHVPRHDGQPGASGGGTALNILAPRFKRCTRPTSFIAAPGPYSSTLQTPMPYESEWLTRKKRIDSRLKALGWAIRPYSDKLNLGTLTATAVEELPTRNGPADYGLFVGGQLLGIIEVNRHAILTHYRGVIGVEN